MTDRQDQGLAWVIEAGGMLGWGVDQTLQATVPALMLAIRGYQRAQGINPDAGDEAMSRTRMKELLNEMSEDTP